MKRILVADDEPNLRRVLAAVFRREGYDVITVEDGTDAVKILAREEVHAIIADLKMPRMDGMTLLRHVTLEYPDLPVVIITAHGTVDTAVEALKLGAFDYITKPFEQDELRAVIRKALLQSASSREEIHLTGEDRGKYEIIGRHPSMLNVYELIRKVADTPSTVLICGESGTGKELIAKALHENSSRRGKPFIKINCAAIPKTLVESELFGYEKGAFTGAVSSKPGRFELAHEGTLFLDEIAEIPLEMQVKLLRVLQESEFERVGGIKTLRVDVRLVTATNRDLASEIAAGSFREDLFYRLNVVPIRLPALRERQSDIPLLVEHFIAKYNARLKKNVEGIEPEAMARLLEYPWPGNIRELENVMERTILFTESGVVRLIDLPAELRGRAAPAAPAPSATPASLKETVRETTLRLERELIQKALQETGGNVTQAAKRLKISRKSLQNKMKEFGLRDEPGRIGMNEAHRGVLERLVEMVGREDLRALIEAHALGARARLAGDPHAAMAWSALPARRLPADLPAGISSAWVFVVRRGRMAGCHMHPNSVQHSISYEGEGAMLIGPPPAAERIELGDRPDAPLHRRTCVIAPRTYHDAVAGDRDWVVVSFHSAPAHALAEIGYGAPEGTSPGFEYAGEGSSEPPLIRIDPRCRRDEAAYPRVPEPEEFGRVFTPNMFRMIHRPGRGWHHREIVPLENLSLHPATAVLHYGQEVFEGLKAYHLADGAVALFRPELHARRMRASCERMAIPPVEPEDFLSAVKALVSFDQASVPRDPRASLYIRPVCFGSQVGLGVHAASEFLFLVFACIVGQYSGATARPMRVLVMRDLVRAVRGGTGAAKTAGNYAGSLLGIERAKERGFDQVLWLDALELAFIEELGAMNFFAVFGRHLVTPPAGATILAGVTRASILELAPALGLTAEERPLPLEEVLEGARTGDLTEAFAAGTAAVVSPVGEIADGERVARVGGPRMGEVTRSLAAALAEIRAGKDPYGWMVRV